MIITWYGQACFKLQSGEKSLILDPFEKSIGLTPPSGQADIVAVTHEHWDHNNIRTVKGDYFLINSPGEYEVKGIKVLGISSFHDAERGAKRGFNTVYLIDFEGMRILHMGDFGQESLDDRQVEFLGSVDILMLPVGGTFTVDAKTAVGIVNQIEPKIVIPMHYKVPKLTISELDGVDKFLKEFGEEDVTGQNKVTIKQKDIGSEDDKTKLILMKAS